VRSPLPNLGAHASEPPSALRRQYGRRAAVGLALAVALGALGHGSLAIAAAAFSLSLGAIAAWAPGPWLHALDTRLGRLAEGVGVGLSWLVLTPIFWLVVVPLGLLTRRGARDPLARRPREGTYWRPREGRSANTRRPY